MKKTGLTLLTLVIALGACAEMPTAASAGDARPELNGLVGSSGGYTAGAPGLPGAGYVAVPDEAEATMAANPGFGGSGN